MKDGQTRAYSGSSELHPPLAPPKNGHTCEILCVCRVSDPKPGKQDERSLDDQEASYREWLQRNLDRPFEMTVIAGKGSGELLDRDEYQKVIDEAATRKYDLVLCEDLGRIVRRIHAHLFCEHCEDCDTRLYSKNDRVDTALPNWREASIFAAFHHERSNRDTSERIKRTLRNRFVGGGSLRRPPYGWIKPPGSKSDADEFKDPSAEPIYAEWFRILDIDKGTYADVVRYLKAQGILFPSRYKNRFVEPDVKSVARYTHNPLLKGVKEWNHRKTKRINNPGKYLSQKALPEDLLQRRVPHLAFFEESYYDRVVADVDARNGKYRRSDDPRADPCLNRPRKQTRFPGRITYCAICGRQFVWGGHGQTDHLMCNGARQHRCWNGATFDGTVAAQRIANAVLQEAEKLEDFDSTFIQMLTEESRQLDQARDKKLDDLRRQIAQVTTSIANIVEFVKSGKAPASLQDELNRLEAHKARMSSEARCIEQSPACTIEIPPAARIQDLVHECLNELAVASHDFAKVMRKLVPRIVVFPVQLCDGGRVVLRAKFKLHLASLLPDRRASDVLLRPLERVLTIDLFDPPQRERFRLQILDARESGKTERQAAVESGITVTAAQHAAALQRRMDGLAITDPYVPVREPPENCPKLRRHRSPDYLFEPLAGAGEL